MDFPDEKVQKERDYIMENKFELLKPPQGNNDTTDNKDAGDRIFKTVRYIHPIQTMVSTTIISTSCTT